MASNNIDIMRSLAIVSVDNRDLSTGIQNAVRYARGHGANHSAGPLTLAQFPYSSGLSAWTKALYCERHGCTFRLFQASANHSAFRPWYRAGGPEGKLNTAWLKPLTLLHALRTTSFEFVLFTDGDVLFRRLEVSLKPLLKFMRKHDRYLATGLLNVQGHNAGILLVRNRPEAHTFLHSWWATHKVGSNWSQYSNKTYFEQTTLNFAMLAQPRYCKQLVETDLLASGELPSSLSKLARGVDLTTAEGKNKRDRHITAAWLATNDKFTRRFFFGLKAHDFLFEHMSTGRTKARIREDHKMAMLEAGGEPSPSPPEAFLHGAMRGCSMRGCTQAVLVLEQMMRTMVGSKWVVPASDA
jgi:hypothetical protein